MNTLADIGEKEAIKRVCQLISTRQDVIVGPGDDCAVVRPGNSSHLDLLLTSDPLVAGIHFVPGTPAKSIGHKAIGRVLSDIAAMGGQPEWALVNIVAPGKAPVDSIEEIYCGMTTLADQYKLAIVGGDLSEGHGLEIHIFGEGSVPTGKAVLRSGAKLGDLLYVTGTLGGSISGKHLTFMPRIEEGIFLRNFATSMIDLSDGLATDLRHIMEMSHAGATISSANIPISEAATSAHDGISPLDHALSDGEDFELLFTVPENIQKEFEMAWRNKFSLPCTNIGCITDNKNTIMISDKSGKFTDLTIGGFQHFEK